MVARFLEGSADEETLVDELQPWSDDDLALAKTVWGKLSEPARDLFSALMDHPDQQVSGNQLAEDLKIPNAYGVAGVLAWPGRHCYAVGRQFPVKWEQGAVGESGNYWMTPSVAALFQKARDGQ